MHTYLMNTIALNSLCNTRLLPVSNVIIKKQYRKKWSSNFVIANIQPLRGAHLELTWGLSLELVVLINFIAHGEIYILVLHPSPLPKVDTLHSPDESLLA